jgi:hypothetical protein
MFAPCPHRVEPRPLNKRTGVGCIRCRQPVATIEDEGAGTVIFNCPGAATAGQRTTLPQRCVGTCYSSASSECSDRVPEQREQNLSRNAQDDQRLESRQWPTCA